MLCCFKCFLGKWCGWRHTNWGYLRICQDFLGSLETWLACCMRHLGKALTSAVVTCGRLPIFLNRELPCQMSSYLGLVMCINQRGWFQPLSTSSIYIYIHAFSCYHARANLRSLVTAWYDCRVKIQILGDYQSQRRQRTEALDARVLPSRNGARPSEWVGGWEGTSVHRVSAHYFLFKPTYSTCMSLSVHDNMTCFFY